MNDLMKKDYLYQSLKNSIISGEYTEGMKFPKEFELAENYSVARGTLRMALKHLEDEKLIERVKGKGTYVRHTPEKKRAVITYLLPCPNYMTQSGAFAFRHNQAMEGIMKRCQELNCQMETIAVSPTNSMDDIDWRQLEHLNSESRIVTSDWFYPMFNFLKARHCKVFSSRTYNLRLASPLISIPPALRIPPDWFAYTYDVPGAFELAVGKLREAGCSSIAIAANWLSQPKGVIAQGYRDGIKTYGLEKELKLALIPEMPPWPYLRERLTEWHEKEKFDGLILCPRSVDVPYGEAYSNSILNLPDTVKIIQASCIPELSFKYGTLPMIYFDYFEYGYQGVSELMAEPFIPGEKIVRPQFSSGNSVTRFSENNHSSMDILF